MARVDFISFANVSVAVLNPPANAESQINHLWQYYNPVEDKKSDLVEFGDQKVTVAAWRVRQKGKKALTLVSTKDGNREVLATITVKFN